MKEQEYKIRNLTRCSVCKAKYNHSQTIILKEDADRKIFYSTCNKCGTAMLTFVSEGQRGLVSVGMISDLTRQEIGVLFEKQPIKIDSVLDVYRELNLK